MATFQSFFQSGRAKDLSAPLYILTYLFCNTNFVLFSHLRSGFTLCSFLPELSPKIPYPLLR